MGTVAAGVVPQERNWFKALRLRFIAYFLQREEQVFLLLSLIIGAITGLAVVAFILLTERLGLRLYPAGGAGWRRLAVPVVGSLAMGYLLYRYFPNARGSGVPQTKAALFAHNGYISLKTVLGKFVCTATTLASGIPLGREGPSVQVGAGIASVLGRWLGLRPDRVRALIPVGAAAAIAAAFNTPLAAVVFALEEIMGDMNAPVLGSVVLASATSWAVLRLLLGNDPLFKVPEYSLQSAWEFLIYALLGVLGGFLSVAFARLLLGMRKWFLKLPTKTRWWHPVVGGLFVGIIGWFIPQVLGVGYTYVGQALNGQMALRMMLLLIVLKLFGVTLSYATGNAGGIFGPALVLGSMLGGAVGTVAHHYFPAYTAAPGAYALVGMGALFAGIVRVPMTSVLMIFEMTRDYAVIVPLMIANMTSLFIASIFQKTPIYEALADQDGIHLPSSEDRRALNERTVSSVLDRSPHVLSAGMSIADALSDMSEGHFRTLPVMDGEAFLGLVSKVSLENSIAVGISSVVPVAEGESLKGTAVRLQDLTIRDYAFVHADQPLYIALERMSKSRLDVVPVVHRANIHKLEGIVTLREVLDSYGVEDVDGLGQHTEL